MDALIGFMRAIWDRFTGAEKRMKLTDPALADIFGRGATSTSGAVVTEETAINLISVFACVRIIAETIGSLPLQVFRRLDPRGKEIDRKHPLWRVLNRAPNPWMTSFTFRETMMGHVLLRGNAFAEKVFDGAGNVIQLWPISPDRVRIVIDSGDLFYEIAVPDAVPQRLPAQRVLHLRGFSGDGVTGYSPIRVAREAIGLALATEECGARLFGNGSQPGGIFTHPGKLSPEAKKSIKASWESAHSGLSNLHRLAVLEEGMKWEKIGIDPEDAQFLETRRYQLEEIARLFRVPLHLLGHLENASYATVEQQGIDFAVHCIRPWLVRFEAELQRQVFTERDADNYFAEHKLDALLRGAFNDRQTGYATGRQWGWYSIDDVREMENLNPLADGRGADYMQPMNMVAIPSGGLANVPVPAAEPVIPPAVPEAAAPTA